MGKTNPQAFFPSWKLLLLLFPAVILCHLTNHSYGQTNGPVPASGNADRRIPLVEALRQVNHVFGTNFLYDKALLMKKTTTYDVKNMAGKSLEEVLKGVLYPDGLVFLYVKQNYYTIIPKEKAKEQWNPGGSPGDSSVLPSEGGEAEPARQVIGISGLVTDRQGHPLGSVSIAVMGSPVTTYSDPNGHYKIEAVYHKGLTLVFTSVGYEAQNVPVRSGNIVNVVLRETSVALQEVVVVGYGTEKKEDLTGSISTIRSKELNENHSSTAVSDMLSGRLAGLYVQRSDGTVGSGSDLKVRGLSTFNNSNPLIIIDGIPGRSIDDLNPTDIESISVLKDAASIAVYGARAANGVVLVTTKRGNTGRPEINFSSTLIDQQPTFIPKQVNSYEYALLQNEALQNEDSYNPALGEGYTQSQLQRYQDGSDPNQYPNTNWAKSILKSHILQSNYNLSAAGGSDNIKYFLSIGYVKNGGYTPVEYYKRWNLRSNIEANITPNLKVGLNVSGVLGTTNGEGVYGMDYVVGQAFATPPIRVDKFTNGTYAYVPEQRGNADAQSSGLTGYNTTHNNTLNSTFFLQYDLPWVKGLSILGTAAYDKGYSYAKRFALPYNQYSIDSAGDYANVPAYPTAPYLSEGFTQSEALTLEASVRYAGAFGRHHITGLLLYTQTDSTGDNFSAERQNFVSGSLAELSLGDPSQSTNSGSGAQSARQGVVGRVTYDFASRYLAEFNFRDDGSDIFPPGHRFGFFPSISGGWILSNEPFYKNLLKGLDFLKIRGSWGQLGNDQVDPYQYLSTYSLVGGSYPPGGYTFGGPNPVFYQALQPGVLPNPSFTWERAIMTNIGIEAHYRRDLITLEVDYFRKRTRDILTPPALQVPGVIGLALPDYNNGIVDNHGLEVVLGHTNHIGKVGYFVELNLSYNRDKIVSYPESQSTPAWQKITGLPVGAISYGSPVLGYLSQGLYQTAQQVTSGPTPLFSTVAPGDIRYKDVDGDGAITPNDEVAIGQKLFPGIQYGIRWGVHWQNLELNVLFQGSADVQQLNVVSQYNIVAANAQQVDHWTPQNTGAPYPRLWINYQNNEQNSDYWIVNSSYMRVKNMELAYTLPLRALQRSGIKNIRIAVSGNNLITFSKFKWFDPEMVGALGGNSAFPNPLMKSFTAGLSLVF